MFLFSPGYVSAQVVINEFSSASSDDWVEIYAIEDTDINGWYLRDTASSIMKEINSEESIGPSTTQFLAIDVSNRLNNKGDTIFLYNQLDEEVDQISYGDENEVCLPSESGSVGRFPDGNNTWERFQQSSKGDSNNDLILSPCPSPTTVPTSTPTPTPHPSNTPKPTNTPRLLSTTVPTALPVNEAILGAQDNLLETSEKSTDTENRKNNTGNSRIDSDTNDYDLEKESNNEIEMDYGNSRVGPIFLVFGGLGFMTAAGYPIIKNRFFTNGKYENKEED